MLNKSRTYFQLRSFLSLCTDVFTESTETNVGSLPVLCQTSKQRHMGLEEGGGGKI